MKSVKETFVLLFLIHFGYAENSRRDCTFDTDLVALTELICIPKNYSKITAPGEDLVVHIEIEDAPKVHDMSKSLEMTLFLSLIWEENRFSLSPEPFEYFALPSEFIDALWMPHLKSKGLNKFRILEALDPWKTVYLTNDSEIHYEIEANVNFRCNMKFDYFPMDVNFCPFTLYVEKMNMNISDSIAILDSESMKAEPFEIELGVLESKYGEAILEFVIRRRLSPFIMKYYLPSIGIVFISQMSFLINPEQLPARVAVLVTSFLILSNTITREQVRI